MVNATSDLLARFEGQLQQLGIRRDDRLLLAVSGGLDSTVLAHLCHQAQRSFQILHCNFQLRGAESERDAAFVQAIAAQYGVAVSVQTFDTAAYATQTGLSVQEAARTLRYQWFEAQVQQLLQQLPHGFDRNRIHVLTAHHADDNTETLLHHFFRGTGLRGLTGIPPAAGNIKRPLLPFTRFSLEQYARQQQRSWVEDASNTETYYTRNFLRHKVLPLLQQAYPHIQQRLQHNIQRFSETELLYRVAVDSFKKQFLFKKKLGWQIPIRALLPFRHTALLYELLSSFGFTEKQLPDVWKLTEGISGRYVQAAHKQYRIIRHRHWLLLTEVAAAEAGAITIDAAQQQVIFPEGILNLQLVSNATVQLNSNPYVAQLDAHRIQYPLLLRPWKAGDYFYPLGLAKKKKIARFLIDLKLSLPQKEAVWVLESAGRIIWVVGLRLDDRFKRTNTTNTILTITLQ